MRHWSMLDVPRNENLEAAMAAAGYKTYAELAKASGASILSVSRLSRMLTGVTYKSGGWTPVAEQVARALQVHPTLLEMGEVNKVKKDYEITEADRLSILAEANPPATPFEELAREEDEEIAESLLSGLSHQMRVVIQGRAAGKTLDAVGLELGVTRERVRQIEMKALRIARHRLSCAAAREA